MKPFAIFELEAIGVNGAYEATGIVHLYCCRDHAGRHEIAEGFRTSANYSKPEPADSGLLLPGLVCEWCGRAVSE